MLRNLHIHFIKADRKEISLNYIPPVSLYDGGTNFKSFYIQNLEISVARAISSTNGDIISRNALCGNERISIIPRLCVTSINQDYKNSSFSAFSNGL